MLLTPDVVRNLMERLLHYRGALNTLRKSRYGKPWLLSRTRHAAA